jgi:hypothetical protein
VWASSPGIAERKNPTTGIRINSNGVRMSLNVEKCLGFFGFWILSITRVTKRKVSEIVKMKDESLGTVYPRAVLAKAGLRREGIESPIVIVNQLTGQRK